MKILVIGDVCKDITIFGNCTRICPEGPIPVFTSVSSFNDLFKIENHSLGMAGNVANNFRALGCDVKTICNSLSMPVKLRGFDETFGSMSFRADFDDRIDESPDMEKVISSAKEADAVVISDYNKGFLTKEEILKIMEISRSFGKPCLIDTKKSVGVWLSGFDFVKINKKEYDESLKINHDVEQMTNLIVTLGADGCTHKHIHVPSKKIAELRSVSGAGDSFLAAFTCKWLIDKNVVEAMKYANECCATVVSFHGVTPIPEEMRIKSDK